MTYTEYFLKLDEQCMFSLCFVFPVKKAWVDIFLPPLFLVQEKKNNKNKNTNNAHRLLHRMMQKSILFWRCLQQVFWPMAWKKKAAFISQCGLPWRKVFLFPGVLSSAFKENKFSVHFSPWTKCCLIDLHRLNLYNFIKQNTDSVAVKKDYLDLIFS